MRLKPTHYPPRSGLAFSPSSIPWILASNCKKTNCLMKIETCWTRCLKEDLVLELAEAKNSFLKVELKGAKSALLVEAREVHRTGNSDRQDQTQETWILSFDWYLNWSLWCQLEFICYTVYRKKEKYGFVWLWIRDTEFCAVLIFVPHWILRSIAQDFCVRKNIR